MTQADGHNELQRVALRMLTKDNEFYYLFNINPDDYEETHPQRTSVIRTREAVVVEDFGPDIGTIRFSGTTGVGTKGSGAKKLFALEKILTDYSKSGYTTEPNGNPNNAQLLFYNNTDGKSWYVHLDEEGFNIRRTAEESLLYRYSISLKILRDASQPSKREVEGARMGNPLKVKNYETTTHYANQVLNPRTTDRGYEDPMDRVKESTGVVKDDEGPTMLED